MIEHGQWGAYWIPPHLTKPLAQFHFCSLTCLAASTPFLSSFRSQLLLEAYISLGFLIFLLSDFSPAVILHFSGRIWVLIGFCHISRSHLHSLTFVHSLVLPLALRFYPPQDCNFCWRHIFHLDFSFSAFGFLTSSNLAFVSDNMGVRM